MTDKLTPSEIETLRGKVMRDEIAFVDPQNWPAFLSKDEALRYLDRLSPAPEPEVDEATVWARKVFQAIYKLPDGDHGHEGGAPFNRVRAYLRQAIAELIASKDGEIATLSELRKVAARNAGAADRARFKAESELATLRAENERLKALSDGLRTYMYDKDASRREWVVKKYKAAERNTAEPATETTPDVDAPVDSGMDAEAVEQAELLWAQLPVNRKWTSIPTHEKALVCHLLSTYRTEAEARGRRQALEEVLKWLRSPEGKGSDAGIDYADGFADQIERMMTGGK